MKRWHQALLILGVLTAVVHLANEIKKLEE